MPTPSEKLASSLEKLKELQQRGHIAIQSKDLSRTHRERLLRNGFIQEVIKGWYIPARLDQPEGESTIWYASFWNFCSAYFNQKFGDKWCLSPEQSLSLHAGNWTVPKQLIIRSPKASNNIILLPHQTSVLDVRNSLPKKDAVEIKDGIRIFSLPTALVESSSRFFLQAPTDARTALSLIRDASEVLRPLLLGNHSVIAGRLAGAFRNINRSEIADQILKTMQSADYHVREMDPFVERLKIIINSRERSPYVNRMSILWQEMRSIVMQHFPKISTRKVSITTYIKQVEEIYATDAYHSLSIEGYHVSAELIQRVRSGAWNPDKNEVDQEHTNALAARGYWQAFKAVEESIRKVFRVSNPGNVFEKDHRDWYRELFGPSVTAGILEVSDLAGYRRWPVYIRRSMHVPPNPDAVRDLMPAFCELLIEEKEAAVRAVLGHFFFVYIHPYMDGNGRLGRFLMNLMLAAGNYPWIVIPVDQRSKYFSALEVASVEQNILPFTQFISKLVSDRMQGKALPKIR